MTARQRMTMRAALSRNAAAGDRDRNNQPAAENWQPLALDQYAEWGGRVPCFLWSTRERQVDGPVNGHVETLHLGIPVDAGLTPADRVTGVYDRLGTPIMQAVFRITGDQRMGQSHRELTLEVVASHVGAAA